MWREEKSSLSFAVIKNNAKWYPIFSLDGKEYSELSWILTKIKIENKTIVPKEWTNAWIEIDVQNLLLSFDDEEGWFILSVPLYSDIWRTVLNSLAWSDPLWMIYLSVYLNKNQRKKISIKKYKSEDKTDTNQWYAQLYTYEDRRGMLTKTKVKGKDKDDYDKLTDTFVEVMIPIIEKKLSSVKKWNGAEDDLPF